MIISHKYKFIFIKTRKTAGTSVYEKLNEELTNVFDFLGIPFNGKLTINAKSEYRTNKKPYQEHYTQEQKEIVSRLFDKEIDLHNYSF